MHQSTRFRSLAGLIAGVFLACGAQADSQLLRCGAVVDVERERILVRSDIAVKNGVIEAVGQNLNAGNAAVIDLGDEFCMPGLMDMHTHLFIDSRAGTVAQNLLNKSSGTNALQGLKRAQSMLKNGFTTVRVPGDIDYGFAAIDIRNSIERGEFIGPRMLVAPHALSQLGGHGDLNAIRPDGPTVNGTVVQAGVDNVREAVRRQVKYGADWIKIMASGGVMSQHDDPQVQGWTDEEIFAFADEAHRLGVKITAHVHGNQAGMTAVRAGFDSIEHGTMLEDETIRAMAESGVVLVPTRYVLEWILEQGVGGGITEDNLRKARMVDAMHRRVLARAYDAGVTIAMGSDPIFPHDESTREFAALVRAGLSPWDAIKAGTINAAELIDLGLELGSVKAGKIADIVAVPQNPVEDISALERVGFVMKAGVVVRNDY